MINISDAEYKIYFREGFFYLNINNKLLKTPKGEIIKHTQRKIIEYLKYELETMEVLDTSILSYYSLLCTQIDLIENDEFVIDKINFRKIILSDVVLSSSAGPEVINQYEKWESLFDFFELLNVKHPHFIQSPEIDYVENWILTCSDEYKESVNKIVDLFYQEFNLLNSIQKTIVINAISNHSSITYGIMLASKKCTEVEYVVALLAGYCLLPNIFSDISRSEYKESFDSLKNDARLFTEFMDSSLIPNLSVVNHIKNNIPNYGFLPESSQIALKEAVKNINYSNSDDYSSNVMLLGKSVEICLKKLVFDEFQIQFDLNFEEESQKNIYIKENEKIRQLARFIVKEPHFIEFGSMIVILEKYGGKTSKQNSLLNSFFEFVISKSSHEDILSLNWIEKAKELSKYRNMAAHSERFNYDQAKQIQDLTFELITVF